MPTLSSTLTGTRFAGGAILIAVFAALLGAGCGGSSASTSESSKGSSSGNGKVRVAWQQPETEEDAVGYELLTASETKNVASSLAPLLGGGLE